jgi:hypothetical protein
MEKLAPLIVYGILNRKWNKRYSSDMKGTSRIYPDDLGSGLVLLAPKLFPQDLLPIEVQQLNETANGLIYVLTSTSYPILYVGISAKNLSKGLFNEGRISHHLRKIFAIHSVSTSHTKGWQKQAISRYEDRIIIKDEDITHASFSTDMSCVGSDLQISFGYCNDDWNPEDYEGTVFDYFESRLKLVHSDLLVMNTKKMNRSEALISKPSNLDVVLNKFGALDLSDVDHSLKIQIAAKRYAQLKIKDPNASMHFIATISKVFKRLWDDSWKETLHLMADNLEVIDDCAELTLDLALHSNAKTRLYKEFIQILDIYVKVTYIHMNDLEEKGEWRLKKINKLLEISKRKLSK